MLNNVSEMLNTKFVVYSICTRNVVFVVLLHRPNPPLSDGSKNWWFGMILPPSSPSLFCLFHTPLSLYPSMHEAATLNGSAIRKTAKMADS